MIRNERQYRITRTQVRKLERALREFLGSPSRRDMHPTLQRAQEEGLRSQLSDLQAELNEYESLRSPDHGPIVVHSLEELPHALIKARIASGMSQRELAERLGLKEQQIQRYEATDYESANLSRVLEVARALGVDRWRDAALFPSGRAKG